MAAGREYLGQSSDVTIRSYLLSFHGSVDCRGHFIPLKSTGTSQIMHLDQRPGLAPLQ